MLHNSTASTVWKLQIFRVQDSAHQQLILSAFHRIARPGVTVLGTQSGPEWFIIVECSSPVSEREARRLVTRIDPTAMRTYDYEIPPERARTRPSRPSR